MEDVTNHYRAIKYAMGPLNVVARFEVDAHYDNAANELTPAEIIAATGGWMNKLRYDYRGPINVLQKGHIVPVKQMAELKARPTNRTNAEAECGCRNAWINSGLVARRIPSSATTSQRPEEKQQENLRKLAGLLSGLKAVVRNEQGPIRVVVLVWEDKSGPLVIRSIEQKFPIVQRDFRLRHWAPKEAPPHGPPRVGAITTAEATTEEAITAEFSIAGATVAEVITVGVTVSEAITAGDTVAEL
ncbi:hypothetical protein K469DRAFT_684496 [Zopfia rhizophila CBS 207.26]|uniref:Uncharacterized protein n=1 Tax=Zopfia rhizophila CBS 207.26 TaxID=1314779 RepID=A0A6A6EBL3_9PEZI|nr:hypothetical protein K469DRAFT_684496 [Zopfia rhizophila CBS 207.26]